MVDGKLHVLMEQEYVAETGEKQVLPYAVAFDQSGLPEELQVEPPSENIAGCVAARGGNPNLGFIRRCTVLVPSADGPWQTTVRNYRNGYNANVKMYVLLDGKSQVPAEYLLGKVK